jgi:hypothetical protein
MLRPSLWFVTGQNAVCYNQVDDLLPVKTLYATTKFMICYWSKHCMLQPSLYTVLWPVTNHKLGRNIVFWPATNHKFGSNIQCSDQKQIINLVVTLLRPSLWFVTGQNTVCYDEVYDLLLVRTLYVTTKFMICYRSISILTSNKS